MTLLLAVLYYFQQRNYRDGSGKARRQSCAQEKRLPESGDFCLGGGGAEALDGRFREAFLHGGIGIERRGGDILGKIFQRKHVWIVFVYAALYMLGFGILEKTVVRGYHVIHMAVDDWIPFCEYFIVPYTLWFFYIAATVLFFAFFNKNVKEYWQLVLSLGIGMTLFLLISWLYPNGQDLRPVVFERENVFVDLVRQLYRVDTPTNIFPSIHVFNSVAVFIAIDKCRALQKYRVLRKSALVLSILIVLSTMFLKQHSVFDVMCALALNAAVYTLLYVPKEQWALFAGRKKEEKKTESRKRLQDLL